MKCLFEDVHCWDNYRKKFSHKEYSFQMSSHIRYEDAIIQLVEMFPTIDVDVIKGLLNDNST